MIIGLDIDNVISDYENGMIRAMLEDDVNKRNAGIINPNARNFLDGLFDWTKEEIDNELAVLKKALSNA